MGQKSKAGTRKTQDSSAHLLYLNASQPAQKPTARYPATAVAYMTKAGGDSGTPKQADPATDY